MTRIKRCLQNAFFCFLYLAFTTKVSAKEYSITDLVTQTKSHDLTIRIKAENLFRAYQNVHVAIGRLLPGINISVLSAAAAKNFVALAELTLGFLFPSNWFQWKENKLLYQAERYSYVSLVANEISMVVIMAYQIHFIQSILDLAKHQTTRLQTILEIQQLLHAEGTIKPQVILAIRNIYLKLETEKLLLEQELKKLKITLANGMGLPLMEWDSFELAPITLPDLRNQEDFDAELHKETMIANSSDLVTFDYLILASKFAMLTRVFEFMLPGANQNANLGVGYPSYIRVGKSMTRELRIKKLDAIRKHHALLEELAINHNTFIKVYKLNIEAEDNESQITSILEVGASIDTDKISDNIDRLTLNKLRVLDAQHKFLATCEQIDRILMRGPHYDRLIELAPKKIKRHFNFIHKIENQRIHKAVSSGKIRLPHNHTL